MTDKSRLLVRHAGPRDQFAGNLVNSLLTTRRLFWPLQIGGWLLLTPFFMLLTMTVLSDWATVVPVTLIRQAVGFTITLGLWRLYRRWPAHDFKILRRAGPIAAACVAATMLDLLAIEGLRHALGMPPVPEQLIYGVLILRGTIYVAWTALYFLIRHEIESRGTELRLARAEAASREAELLQLRAQMNPHFLFNALSNIVGQAERDPAAVIETTHAVSDYLRYSLQHSRHHAPLGAEIDAMRNYLQVERSLHGSSRLLWQIEATEEARQAIAPTALVQPLIENAIKYGIRTSPVPLQLKVTASVHDGRLRVVVENTGKWIERAPGEESRDSTGIGLANLRRRLELLYDSSAQLEVTTPPGLIRVAVTLPLAG